MATDLYASGEAVALEDGIPLSKLTGHSLLQERWDRPTVRLPCASRDLLLATVQFLKLLFGPRVLRIQLQNFLIIRFRFLSLLVGYVGHRQKAVAPERGRDVDLDVQLHDRRRLFAFALVEQTFRQNIQGRFPKIVLAVPESLFPQIAIE